MGKWIRKSEMPDEIIELGVRIKRVIEQKGLKTRHVAHDADLDTENLRKYINGKQEMKVSILIRIAKALDVKVSDLFD